MQAAAAMSNIDGVARLTANLNMNGSGHHVTEHTNPEVQVQHTNAPPMDERALSGLQARMERLKSNGFTDAF
jgi:cytoskeleton-associated protein 5